MRVTPEERPVADAADARASDTQRLRPSMASRVAIGFVAVALAVFIANLVTQQSARTARERVRQLLMHHEPLVRATEALAAAVSHYERVVVDQYESNAYSKPEVDLAARRIEHAARAYRQASLSFPSGLDSPPDLGTRLEAFTRSGALALQHAASRRSLLKTYWERLDEIERQLNRRQDRATRFAGAVFASESVLELQSALSGVRERVSAAATMSPERVVQPIVAAETAFKATLQQHRDELEKYQGAGFTQEIQEKFNRLVVNRRAAFKALADFNEQRAAFRDEGAALLGSVMTQLVEPARRALADADRLAVDAANKADRQLVWMSAIVMGLLLVIAIATVSSVTRPVKRLIAATRRIASGAVRTRVPRGGVRELDVLAGAFNQMAEHLERVESEVRAYQAELEAKVDERTRELTHLAHHDPLTQLPNRRQLFSHLSASLQRARDSRSRVAVLFIDLDNFKTINDSLGHAFGDSVLQAVSERLRLNSRLQNTFTARLGGDEFTVVCEGLMEMAEAERLAQAVLEEFQRSLTVHGRELRISVSVGASVFPDHAVNSQALLRAADAALFRAKERGRSCFMLFAPELVEEASSRFRMEQALRRAVEQGEFELVYQPEVCFETLETHTVEALLRWRQPDGAVVSPAEFFAVAEQSGLITEISDWVLRSAIAAAAAWRTGMWPKAKVAVNISSQHFWTGDFVERVHSLLQLHSLPPEALEIELTENVLQTGAATIDCLQRLRALGVSIALDDFGTGYSSLTSLERLPLTRVKIDRSLISSLDTGGRSPAIVRSIVGLCHSLGLQVTAEGVERPGQLGALLNDRGVQVQGFLISRPLNPSALAAFLADSRKVLEDLVVNAPMPAQDLDTSARLRVLRMQPSRLRTLQKE